MLDRPHHHDDDHHGRGSRDPQEISRRRVLYLMAAGVAAETVIGSTGTAAVAARRAARTTKTALKRTAVTTSSPGHGTTTTVKAQTSATDPWSMFSKTAHATRTATEVVVTSTGLPEHPMMIGITSWQQQVPVPQPYTGSNAWRLPLKGVLSDTPISGRHALYRGAIALAVNGVPIFNALNNRGGDAFLFGELDQWGGHCGRADDYHYHAAPLHLQKVTGLAAPIAFALDGFPVYGLREPDGSAAGQLDGYNGHVDPADGYHYHSTLVFPYINGGLRGTVEVRNDGVEPQPVTPPMRPPGEPLRGATITAFTTDGTSSRLEYRLNGSTLHVDYVIQGTGVTFIFTDPTGATRTETYERRTP